MSEMEPTTEAGRVLHEALSKLAEEPRDKLDQFIVAIEDEAAAAERDRIRVAVEAFPDTYLRAAVLSIVDSGWRPPM